MRNFSEKLRGRRTNLWQKFKINRRTLPARYRMLIYIVIQHLLIFWNRFMYRTVTTEFLTPSKSTLFVNDTLHITEEQMDMINQGFMIGYTIANIPAGFLCDIFAPKLFIVMGAVGTCLFTALMPVAIKYYNWISIVCLTFVLGASQGVVFPGSLCLLGHWFPLKERTTSAALLFGMQGIGRYMGNRFTIAYIKYTKSWVYIFYVWVAVYMIYCLLFTTYASNTPEEDKFIHQEEREYLRKHIPKGYRKVTPVVEMFMDINIWLIVISNIVSEMLYYFCVLKIRYKVCSSEIDEDEFHCQLARLAQFMYTFSCLFFGLISDYLIWKCRCKIVFVRILSVTIGMGLASCCLIPLIYNQSVTLYISIMYTLIFLKGAYEVVTILDCSINHIGFIMGFVNTIEFIAVTYFRSFITHDMLELIKPSITVCWIFVLIYCAFAKGYRAKWDYHESEEIKVPKSFSWSCVHKKNVEEDY